MGLKSQNYFFRDHDRQTAEPTNCSDRRSQGGRCGRPGRGPWVPTFQGGRASSEQVPSQDRPRCWLKRRRSVGSRRKVGEGDSAPRKGSFLGGRHLGCGCPCFPFAGRCGERPYKVCRAQARCTGRIRSETRPTPQGRRATSIPVVARHEPVTGGARVCQVGVNPLRRAVVVVGVDAVLKAK
jgi:hypothetical protein